MSTQDYMKVTLPSEEEILKRLKEIQLGEPPIAERLYRAIAKEGGREIDTLGLNLMLGQKIYSLAEKQGMPSLNAKLIPWVPKFIDALVDDKDAAKEAKKIFEDASNKDRD